LREPAVLEGAGRVFQHLLAVLLSSGLVSKPAENGHEGHTPHRHALGLLLHLLVGLAVLLDV